MRIAPLLPEQEELLSIMVEATRSQPRAQRQPFLILGHFGGTAFVHPGLEIIGKSGFQPYVGDAETLAERRLIRLRAIDQHSFQGEVTPEGFQYYELMKMRVGAPVITVEQAIRTHIDEGAFRSRHSSSYSKWELAEKALWSSDSSQQMTTIGHLCREAMQHFASELVERHRPSDAPTDPSKTVARIRSVIHLRLTSERVRELADALVGLWGAVSDSVQRQEHGAQKEGVPLVWEDARRVVFMTLVAMSELDRSLQ
jgi:hypothetical protein